MVLVPERARTAEIAAPPAPRRQPSEQPSPPQRSSLLQQACWKFRALVGAGIAVRLLFVYLAGSRELTFHSGGSDAPSYVLLAQNLLGHLGFAYDGFPSAVRPPGYPLLLAAAMAMFGDKYILATRALQFLLGVGTVFLCAAAARRLCDVPAARASLLGGLFLPTLLFTTAQLLTECAAGFLTALFLRELVSQREHSDLHSAATLGWTAGVASLFRFNAAALPVFAALAILRSPDKKFVARRASLALGIPLLIVAPWLIRNELAFHGQVLYSTQSGPNAVQGVLTSQGRTQPGDSERLSRSLGWEPHQVETNSPARAKLPSEAVLDRAALRLVPGLWAREGWHAGPLLVKKLGDFWLSLDQLANTSALPPQERLLRIAGVLCYWMVLVAAVAGWRCLRQTDGATAELLLLYAAGLTLLHLPLVMNTRLRIPLLEPLFVILAGVGARALGDHFPRLRYLLADRPVAP
jgi:4-amino-4-deoxy-L-arabinose transferase-like glycosyltransferase